MNPKILIEETEEELKLTLSNAHNLLAMDIMKTLYKALRFMALSVVLNVKDEEQGIEATVDNPGEAIQADTVAAGLLVAQVVKESSKENRGFDMVSEERPEEKEFTLTIKFMDTPVTTGAAKAHLN